MKPHRRKDNPPRREKGSGEPPAEASGAEAEVPADPPTEAYDPGQALAEEGQAYVDPAAAADPNQAYVDPNQAYVDPNQAYVDPNQAYVDPNQAYVDPNQAAADPGQAYVDPNQAYLDPAAQTTSEGAVPPPPAISTPSQGVYDEGPAPAPAPTRQPAPAPKKKVVSGRVASRRPVTRKGAYKRPKTYEHKEGISMMTVFLALVAIAMLVAVAMVMMPRDMSSVKGYPMNPMASGGTPRNILTELQGMMIERGDSLTLSEAELNLYMNQRLQGQQGGPLAPIVKFKGVYADISPELAEFVIEREIFGFPITMTSQVRAERARGFTLRPAGWTIGKIKLSGNSNLKPVVDAFVRLRNSFQDEYEAVKRMSDVRFEQDKLVIDSAIR